jgi:2-polyprenyl-3-methyl-5-hydroxy-6-metoxy-1,4-benzoquinol methylase
MHLFIKQEVPFYKCGNCSFIFSRPEMNPNLSNTIENYEPAYLDYFNEKPLDEKNHNSLLRLIKKQKPLKGSQILDVGCGSGKFVKYLRGKGLEAFGLEPSKALFNTFLKNSYFFNTTASGFLVQFPSDKFDIIVVSDVLEHIEEPQPFIKDIYSLMSPGAVLFISTPNTSSLFAKVAGKNWHYYNKYHLSLFSKSILAKTLARFDLIEVASGTVTRYHTIYYVIKYLFNFILHKEYSVPKFLARINIPVNLLDNMYAIFKNAQ